MKTPLPPKDLDTSGKKFWTSVLTNYELDESQDLERLHMAGRCLDEIAADEKVVAGEGRFIDDRFHQKREHPAAKAIRDNKVLFCRIVRELALDLNVMEEARIPRQYGEKR
jgi:hypothetical protein